MTELTKDSPNASEVNYWNQRFKECQQARRQYEDQWLLNMAFYFGRQWATWKSTTTQGNRLVEPPAPRNRVRLVTNKVQGYVRKEHSKLTKEEPIWYVVPESSEPDDVSAARAAESITEYLLKEGKFKAVRRRSTLWASLCGTSFIKTTCSGSNANPIMESVTAFHMFVPDLQEETLEMQSFCIHARALPKDTVESFWPGCKVDPDVSTGGAILEQKFFSALGIKSERAVDRKLVYVKEIWVKPGAMKQYPDGAMLVIADNQVLYKYKFTPTENVDNPELNELIVKYPYAHGQFPFKKIDLIPTGGFYGMSTIESLISPQREYNKTRSQMIEIKNRNAKPPLIYPTGALDAKKITSEPGQVWPVKSGFQSSEIHYLTVPQLSNHFPNELEVLNSDMDFITSQSDITRGGAPPGVEASSAIAYLGEQNDMTLYITVASIADAIEGVGQQCLALAQQFWDDEKLIKVVSKDYSSDAKKFKISDIKENTDLRLEAGSIAPQSQAAKQAFLLGLADRGFPLEKVLRYLNMNETQRMYDELQVDSRQAQRENDLMKVPIPNPAYNQPVNGPQQLSLNPEMGGPIVDPNTPVVPEMAPNPQAFPVNPYDNHEIHMYEHGLFMKSNEFELLDGTVKSVMLAHWLMHEQKMEMSVARANQLGNSGTAPQGQSEQSNNPGIPAGAPS